MIDERARMGSQSPRYNSSSELCAYRLPLAALLFGRFFIRVHPRLQTGRLPTKLLHA